MENKNRELRMYFFVPYNISPIQAGIQALHAVVRYGTRYHDDPEYFDWALNHETVVILNGGTSNTITLQPGSMEEKIEYLKSKNFRHSVFTEPDLNYMTSGICFLLDERYFKKDAVWDNLIEDYLNPSDRYEPNKVRDIFGVNYPDVIEMRLWLASQRLANN